MATEKDMARAQRLLNVLNEETAAEVLVDEGMSEEDAVFSVLCGRILNKAAQESRAISKG